MKLLLAAGFLFLPGSIIFANNMIIEHNLLGYETKTPQYSKKFSKSIIDLNKDLEIKKFWINFQAAVNNDDIKTISHMINYPLNIYNNHNDIYLAKNSKIKKRLIVNNSTEFINNYNYIFNEKFKSDILRKEYNDIIRLPEIGIKASNNKWSIIATKTCDFNKISLKNCQVIKIDLIVSDIII